MSDDLQVMDRPPALPPRDREGHKGSYGKVLVVGGSLGMIGAPALAGLSALRGGAGLVTLAVPACIQKQVVTLCPCATSIPLDSPGEQLGGAFGAQLDAAMDNNDVLAVGPGLDTGQAQRDLLGRALRRGLPAVIDADGLNTLARMDDWPGLRRGPVVLTPHPGEFARLSGKGIGEIQSDRQAAAVAAARQWGAAGGNDNGPLVVVLKGAGTVVTDGRRVYVNPTGNPGMGTGGAGDALTGLTAALLGQGLEPFDAAALAVRLHGLAGDLAAKARGEVSLIATDLIDYLPQAIRQYV